MSVIYGLCVSGYVSVIYGLCVSGWFDVEFTSKVVELEDGIFPTTTPPPSRRNRRFRNADMPW